MSSWRDLCCMLNARFPQRSSEMLFVFPSDGTWLRGWWVTASGLRRLPCPALHVPPVGGNVAKRSGYPPKHGHGVRRARTSEPGTWKSRDNLQA